ncbi:MAG: efflux RND transporter periplasmic adaptor subunit [Bacteroidetes bacterium]|nr:efflux RND transporter periplasmic adaptor subunit [Bacteroidota bacterium]
MKKMIIPAMALCVLIACSPRENQNSLHGTKPTPVTTVVVKKEKGVTALRYSGTVGAYQSIPINFQTTGTVQEVLVDAGDAVYKGQLLATLDQSDAKNMYEITLSQYQQAKDAYGRLKTVYEKGSLPEIKWVEMESKLEQAQSALNIAKNNLDKCHMYAPVNGMVGRRNIEPGMSSISLTSAPLELVDIRQVYIKFSVPENEVAKIGKGMKAGFSVSALSDKEFRGVVANISPVADRISRTYEARILVPNNDFALKPGMVCDVKMETSMEKELVLIPYQSISKDNQNNVFVFLVDLPAKKAKKQIIIIGQYQDAGLEVISGLEPGQIIVNGGKEKLSDNSLISW